MARWRHAPSINHPSASVCRRAGSSRCISSAPPTSALLILTRNSILNCKSNNTTRNMKNIFYCNNCGCCAALWSSPVRPICVFAKQSKVNYSMRRCWECLVRWHLSILSATHRAWDVSSPGWRRGCMPPMPTMKNSKSRMFPVY